MIVLVLGVMAAIAYLAWKMPGDAQMRRVPIRVRDDESRRRRR